jgi:alkanesulfonate monooxygenase SsuD/methylene tetrahydromethanopterin reductase-like flavin-dependent oxidoreductase (luciferase family)
MITKFGTLYAGHVDLGDIGLGATALNDRRFDNNHLITIFDRVEQMVKVMDDLGYHSFWAAEHHFQHEGNETIPNLLLLYVHLANITKQLKFGCGFNINPMWHPLRLAEDYATADILTNGRVIFGVGRGYHSREVDTFGVPSTNSDNDANREMFEEQIEIIMKAFNEESFSFKGKHYTLPPEVPYRGYTLKEITLVPRPKRVPVETWQPMVSASQRAMDFMAEHNIQAIIGGGAVTGGPSDDVIQRWADTLANHGYSDVQLGSRLVLGLPTFIADSEKEAMNQARKYLEEDMKMFAPLGFFRAFTPEMIDALGDPKRAPTAGLPTMEDTVASGAWVCGTAEHVTERILEIQDKYPGLEYMHVGCGRQGTPLDVMIEQLERFGKDVMPKFNVAKPS